MRGQAGQRARRIGSLALEANAVTFEPQHAVGQDLCRRQRVPQAIRNGAQILAHHQAAVPVAFDCGHSDQRIERKPHVGAIPAFGPARHPELPCKAQHVVDAQGGGVAHVGGNHAAHRLHSLVLQRERREGRQVPHLPRRREGIRRCPDRHARREGARISFDLAAVEGATQRQVAVQVPVQHRRTGGPPPIAGNRDRRCALLSGARPCAGPRNRRGRRAVHHPRA